MCLIYNNLIHVRFSINSSHALFRACVKVICFVHFRTLTTGISKKACRIRLNETEGGIKYEQKSKDKFSVVVCFV